MEKEKKKRKKRYKRLKKDIRYLLATLDEDMNGIDSFLEYCWLIGYTENEVKHMMKISDEYQRRIKIFMKEKLAKDLRVIRCRMLRGKATPTEIKLFYSISHNVDDRPVSESDYVDTEIGFSIKVREKEAD